MDYTSQELEAIAKQGPGVADTEEKVTESTNTLTASERDRQILDQLQSDLHADIEARVKKAMEAERKVLRRSVPRLSMETT